MYCMIAIGVQEQITVHDGSREEGGFQSPFFQTQRAKNERSENVVCLEVMAGCESLL